MAMQDDLTTAPPPAARPAWWVRMLIGRSPRRTLLRLCVWVGLTLVLFRVIFVPVRVEGISMLPTYRDGSINLVYRWAYKWSPPKRGDVVAVKLAGAETANVMFLKRIIGLPGERIAIKSGVVFINGKPLAEPYLRFPRAPWNVPEKRIKPRHYYVIGDNRQMPSGLHIFGETKDFKIVGKVLF
ncbi:MAG: signal peptidase I [Candidatus Omnitrophica bacterium]|nr:signal peptidase I [Candidatus Omnitrophota bacterium]